MSVIIELSVFVPFLPAGGNETYTCFSGSVDFVVVVWQDCVFFSIVNFIFLLLVFSLISCLISCLISFIWEVNLNLREEEESS